VLDGVTEDNSSDTTVSRRRAEKQLGVVVRGQLRFVRTHPLIPTLTAIVICFCFWGSGSANREVQDMKRKTRKVEKIERSVIMK
jgi:hypothetical protein